jgi:hypothetical protein
LLAHNFTLKRITAKLDFLFSHKSRLGGQSYSIFCSASLKSCAT